MDLSALLSQALVAFVIELDNQFELRMPHRTANFGSSSGPWLTSLAMYFSCMRFVDEEGVSARALEERSGLVANLNGMQRWGYITADAKKVLRARPKGMQARQLWTALLPEIEGNWRERFGDFDIARLREALYSIATHLDPALPDFLPILGFGFHGKVSARGAAQRKLAPVEQLPLPSLLSKALLAFALDFESRSPISLAMSANALRVLGSPARARDMPALSGVSKEAIAMALSFLSKRGYAQVEKGASRQVSLTPKGELARDGYSKLVKAIERQWNDRYAKETAVIRQAIEPWTAELLLRATEASAGNWRAQLPPIATLPYYPMILHGGGYPDGA